jgi:ketosteroid isomerase-like protein
MPMEGPLEVLERRRRILIARDMEAFADLFAEDGVIEMPFAAEGLPARLEGREAIRRFSRSAALRPLEISDLRTDQVHQTSDPEVVILELTSVGRVTTTGESFEVPCVQVFRIRNGEIVLFRDYVGTHSLPDLTTAS